MCVKPITIKVEQSHPNAPPFRMVQVPCGKCSICLQKYQNSWTIRCLEEFKNWPKSSFVTLTYRPNSVPITINKMTGETYNTVFKKHIQDWLKRFRITYKRTHGNDAIFKYYLCSEYGPRTHRPHYHAIFFGLSPDELHIALADWRKRYGYVVCELVDITTAKSRLNSARYIGKYCSKGVFENPHAKNGQVLPTFRLMSKGLGSSYVDKHKDVILNHFLGGSRFDDINDKMIYSINGFNYALPRYYKDKILSPKTRLRALASSALLAKSDEVYCSKLRELCATLSISEFQACNLMVIQEVDANRQRADEVTERQNKVYNRSKI